MATSMNPRPVQTEKPAEHTPFMRQNVRMMNEPKRSKASQPSSDHREGRGHFLDTIKRGF